MPCWTGCLFLFFLSHVFCFSLGGLWRLAFGACGACSVQVVERVEGTENTEKLLDRLTGAMAQFQEQLDMVYRQQREREDARRLREEQVTSKTVSIYRGGRERDGVGGGERRGGVNLCDHMPYGHGP